MGNEYTHRGHRVQIMSNTLGQDHRGHQLNTSIDKEHKELLKDYQEIEKSIDKQLISAFARESKKETARVILKNDIELLRGNAYKDWLGTIDYHYVLHIGIQPKYFMNLDTVKEELRTLEFNLNKFYLRHDWSKWKLDDQFHFVICEEGKGAERHYHCNLHVPKKKITKHQDVNIKNSIHNFWKGRSSILVKEIYDSSGQNRYNTKDFNRNATSVHFSR